MKRINCNFTLQDISTYRSALMGIAILWVVLYHFGFHTPGLSHLVRFSYAGVDIFMFLSGFGLFYSLNKNGDLRAYYKKRVIRIFPTYFIVGIALSLFCYPNEKFGDYLWRCSTLGFWTNGVYYEWFIPSIITLYLLFPLIFSLLKHNRIKIYRLIIALSIIVAIGAVFNYMIIDNWHFLLLYRVPIFLYGALTAFYLINGYSIQEFRWITIGGAIIFICFFVVSTLRTRYIAFTFLTPMMLIIFCLLIKNITIINNWGG